MSHILQNDLDHLIPDARGLGKSFLEILLHSLESVPVGVKVPKRNTVAPPPSRKRELQVVGAERVVVNGCVDYFGQEARLSEEVFCYAKPEAEELGDTGAVSGGLEGRGREEGGQTGVEQIIWSYGTIFNFHQQSTMARRER